MRPLVVTSGSLLAKTRPLDSQPKLLLLRQKLDVGAFEKAQRRDYRSGRPDSADTAVLGQAAVGTGIAIVEGDFNIALGQEETEMDSNYMFLCGVMWCKFGRQGAGKELLRAANSVNPDMSALAWAILAKGARRLRDLERQAQTAIEAQ